MTSVHPPFDVRIFHKELRTLSEAGYDVTLIAPHEAESTVNGIKLAPVRRQSSMIKRMLVTPWQVLKKAIQVKADIYHFHDPELIPVGVLLRAMGKKVVYDVHEDYRKSIMAREYLGPRLRRIVAIMFDAVEKGCAGTFSRVIVATEGIKRRFGRRDTLVIKNYPRLDDDNRVVSAGVNKVSTDSTLKVIYVGALSRERGVDRIISAVGRVDGASLVLYGAFSSETYRREIEKTEGYECVEYCGCVDHAELGKRLSEADIGIVCLLPTPRYIDALPTKLFEYMAHGLPVIASNFPLWKDIVEGAGCGMCVDPEDIEAIANSVRLMAEDKVMRRRMGECGKRTVDENYTWSDEGEKLLTAYSGLLHQGKSRK